MNNMSSEHFENLEEDVKLLIDGIRNKLDSQVPRLSGEERKKLVRDIERDFDDGYGMIDEMDGEIRKAPQAYRNQMTSKARKTREDLTKLSAKLRQLNGNSDVNFTRQELFAGDGASASNIVGVQRARAMQSNAILDRTSQSIARSQQVAVETEHIGHEIISEMGEQRESLLRTQGHLAGTDASLIQSRKILKSMYLRVMTNKLILAVIIILELGILIGVVYWKFFS